LPQFSHKTMKKNNMIKSTKKKETMTKINIKGYSLKYHTYVFNVYNSSNYKKPILKKVNAPMLESAVNVIKKNYPNYSYDLKEINA
jgi:hypothetical protein